MDTTALINMAGSSFTQGKLDEALDYGERALKANPRSSAALNNLGLVLRAQNKLDEAAARFRQATKISPEHAMAWCNLGHVRRHQGRFVEALPAFRKGHELGSRERDWSYASAQWIEETERYIVLDETLPAVLRGDARPSGAREQVELAEFCLVHKRRYADAVRFYAAGFAAEPKLADDLAASLRYNAACAAALAASRQPQETEKVNDDQRAAWRGQALGWLRSDLAAWAAALDRQSIPRITVAQTLGHWLTDPDLAGVRDEAALGRLPPDECAAWRGLWADVAALKKKAS